MTIRRRKRRLKFLPLLSFILVFSVFLSQSLISQVVIQGVLQQGTTNFTSTLSLSGVGTQILNVNGTAAAPSYSFAGASSNGIFAPANNQFAISPNGTARFYIDNGVIRVGATEPFTWSSSADPTLAVADTGLSRTAAGTIAVGNGTQGDVSGNLNAHNLSASNIFNLSSLMSLYGTGTATLNVTNIAGTIGSTVKVDALPTVASGFGTGPAIIAGSTPFAGSINVGTVTPGTGGVINFNGTAFPSAPFCICQDDTTILGIRCTTTTTQLTITAAALTASDIVAWICISSK